MKVNTRYEHFSASEEFANSVIHGFGVVLAVAGLALLLVFAGLTGDPRTIVGCGVFGVTLVLLYAASTLYHGTRDAKRHALFHTLDHAAIFLLIAGTYTPFMLVSLGGAWGWSLFGVIWALALLGIGFRLVWKRRWVTMRIALYVAMGWLVVIAVRPMLDAVAPGGLALLLAGGIAYTGGIAFYAWKQLPYHHALWHACVLLGSVLHFLAVFFYVIP